MMTDASKSIVWKATYLPFGGIYTITGSATLNQRFPGQWFQLESGLHYNWHRHFDPTTGRYIQPDPLGMPDGPSRWAYVNNSPLMYVDPTGEITKEQIALVIHLWAQEPLPVRHPQPLFLDPLVRPMEPICYPPLPGYKIKFR